MSPAVESTFLNRIREHISSNQLDEFSILLHGGEPLLFGIERFRNLVYRLRGVGTELNCKIDLSTTTNGTLVDREWATLFKDHNIAVSLSLDGNAALNDQHRKTFNGNGTYAATIEGLKCLEAVGINPQLLAVSDPQSDPDDVLRHFVNNLSIKKFDIMIPDVTRDDEPVSIAAYYTRLFDLWYDDYSLRGVDIRFLKEMLRGLLGGLSKVETTGLGPIFSATLMPDGSLEPLDVARITGEGSTSTGLNIRAHSIQDVVQSPLWREMYEASLSPHAVCRDCRYLEACGGGYLPHRFSTSARFNNPSVYCKDLLTIFAHVEQRILPNLVVADEGFS